MLDKPTKNSRKHSKQRYQDHRWNPSVEVNELPPALHPDSPPAVAKASGLNPFFYDPVHHIKIFQGDCLEILSKFPDNCVDLIFADPPYMLSNNGITCHAGKMVSVNKGAWDKGW